jgi:hypothetical protein
MASAHIEVTGNTTRLSGQLRAFVNSLQRVQADVNQIKATYDQLALGGDWPALRDALGLEDDLGQGATDAEAIYNIIGSVQTELDGTFINQLLGRLG